MSAAANASAPAKKGSMKLIVLMLAGLIVLAAIGGGVLIWMKGKSSSEQASEDEPARPQAPARAQRDPKAVPTFVPLEAFTVNLADRESERYAQVGITFELVDSKDADAIKNFMPVIRSNILMLLAHKTSLELLEREGKNKLAREVKREAARALGFEVDDDEDDEAAPAANAKPSKKRRRQAAASGPVHAVHFSTFIIQ